MSIKSDILKELRYSPKTSKQLSSVLRIDGKKINKSLKSLKKEGKLISKGGTYSLRNNSKGIAAVLVKLGANFGFAQCEDGSGDIFIPGHSLKGAMPGDHLLVKLSVNPRVEGSREGEVTAVTQCADRIVGTVKNHDGGLALFSEKTPHTPLKIKKGAEGGARAGEIAAGVIIERGNSHYEHRVEITARFGFADSAKECAKAILYEAGINKTFPDNVKAEAKTVSKENITKQDIAKRKDLRNELIFTIDSSHTKDMDDAVNITKAEDGTYQLGVHIADVSHYVKYASFVDNEAINRGNSVYYADCVIPMLPKSLSNGICSLNPGEDRLAFSCIMKLDRNGDLLKYKFVKSIINSHLKGVYEEINTIYNGNADENIVNKYSNVRESLLLMDELYTKLAKLRKIRGSIEIEDDESVMLIDEEGKCVSVERRQRGKAERIIEKFMLLANTSAAKCAIDNDLPFVYRVHEKPPVDKTEILKNQLTALSVPFTFKGEIPKQKELEKILNATRGTSLQFPVHSSVLRSMSKAKYETLPKGHYGLAIKDYSHFTSPIRRYSDLTIHRVLSSYVYGEDISEINRKYSAYMEKSASAATERELISVKAERSCDDCYKAEYMKQFIGNTFSGIITSVTNFGMYVVLPNTVEGLVHISNLPGQHIELSGGIALENVGGSGRWCIGDTVTVKLVNVNIANGNIDFELN